jgi:acyl-CoA thioesterase-1
MLPFTRSESRQHLPGISTVSRVQWLLPAALLLSLCACTQDEPRLPALPHAASLLAFGDSLTSGVGAGTGQDYPSQLARITGFQIVNAGVPMEVTAEAVPRLAGLLEQNQPDLLILIHGGNDLLRHYPPEQTAENLKQMIAEARNWGIRVVMLGVPKPAVFGLSSAEFYDEVAKATQTPIDTAALPSILSDNALKSDLVHPNNDGYRRLAEATAELLKRSGAWNGIPASPE